MEKIKKTLVGENFSLKDFLMEKIIYLVLLVLIIVVICIEPRFLSIVNFKNILAQSSTRIIIALAAGMVLMIRGCDLSTGRMIGLAAVISASMLQSASYACRAPGHRTFFGSRGDLCGTGNAVRYLCGSFKGTPDHCHTGYAACALWRGVYLFRQGTLRRTAHWRNYQQNYGYLYQEFEDRSATDSVLNHCSGGYCCCHVDFVE